MTFDTIKIFLISIIVSFFTSCKSVSSESNVDDNSKTDSSSIDEVKGQILGQLVTKNLYGQKKSSYEFDKSKVFLIKNFNGEDADEILIDSAEIDKMGKFAFKGLNKDEYKLVVNNHYWGGEKSKVKVIDSIAQSLEINLEVLKSEGFQLKKDLEEVEILYGPARLVDDVLFIKAIEKDTLTICIKFKKNGKHHRKFIKSHMNKNNKVVIADDSESISDYIEFNKPEFIEYRLIAGYDFSKGQEYWFKNTSAYPIDAQVLDLDNLDETSGGILMSTPASFKVDYPTLDPFLDLSNFSIQSTFKVLGLPDGYSNVEGAICGATGWLRGIETYGFEFRVNKKGYLQFVLGHASGYYWTVIQSVDPIELEEWYTVTVGYNYGTVNLYINDRLVESTRNIEAINTNGIPFDIGYRSTGTPRNQFDGIIKKIEVYQGQVPHKVDLIVSENSLSSSIEFSSSIDNSSSTVEISSSIQNSSSSELEICESIEEENFLPILSFYPNMAKDGWLSLDENSTTGQIVLDTKSEITEEGLVLLPGHNADIDLPIIDDILNWNHFQIKVRLKFSNYGLEYSGQESMIVGNQRFNGLNRGFELRTDKFGYIEVVFSDVTKPYTWQIFKSENKLELDTWYNIVMTVKNEKLRVYVNEKEFVCSDILNQTNMSDIPIEIGFRQVATPRNPFMGTINFVELLNSI